MIQGNMEKIIELYAQGYSIREISKELGIDTSQVEKQLIEYKLAKLSTQETASIFETTISKPKEERIGFLKELPKEQKHLFLREITEFLQQSNHNAEDVMAALWIIGELKIGSLSHFLCQYSGSPNKNIKRIVFSSMGKIHDNRFIPYLKTGCRDSGIQVRMYAIKSLSTYEFENKKNFFAEIAQRENDLRNLELLYTIIIE